MTKNSTAFRPLVFLLKLLVAIMALVLILCLAFPIGFYGMAMYIDPALPKTSELKTMTLKMPLQIYTADEKLIGQYGNTYSMPIAYEELPKQMINAFLAAEDDAFFEHNGISVKGLGRAITQMVSDSNQQTGGSTITQQVAKNYFLSSEQTFERKLTELFLARKIESQLTKNEIITLYVNKIYLGQGAYGIKAGARRYYNKELTELSLAEIAMLAGLPKAPSDFNPVVNPERALERRNWILGRMKDHGYISAFDYEQAIQEDINLNMYGRLPYDLEMPDLAELARTSLVNQYGNQVMDSGWKVVLTIDSKNQLNAENAINKLKTIGAGRQMNSPTLEAKSGSLRQFAIYKDALSGMNTYPAKITKVLDTRLEAVLPDERIIRIDRPLVKINKKTVRWQVAEGNIIRVIAKGSGDKSFDILYPHIQGALASINPQNGAVIALAAGINSKHANFNRAVQGYRQPGSTIKPIVYAALMEYRKMTPDSIISGAAQKNGWPKGGAGGDSSLRDSMARSRNTSAVNALKKLGLENGITMMSNMGLDKSRIPSTAGLALALGAGEATPLQMATAYSTFINGGHRIQPYIIERIYNFDNDTVYQANPLQACATCFNSDLDKLNAKLAEEFEMRQKVKLSAVLAEEADNPKNNQKDKKSKDAKHPSDKPSNPQPPKPNNPFGLAPKAPVRYSVAEQAPRILSTKTANNMASMLKSSMAVTGKAAMISGRSDIGGKTGTTNLAKDVWFAGVHPTNAAVVWVGFDTPKPVLGGAAFGGTVAAPIWHSFMVDYLADKSEDWVEEEEAEEDTKKSKAKDQEVSETAEPTNDTTASEQPQKPKKKAETAPPAEEAVDEGVDALPGDEAAEADNDIPEPANTDNNKTP